MTKITGNEPVNSIVEPNERCGVSEGIPIRLHIAVMIFNGLVSSWGQHDCDDYEDIAFDSICAADTLIARYNNTNNPNDTTKASD
jgi:hypothetical protein